MKILAAPAFKNANNNPYNQLLYSHLLKIDGVSVEDLGWRTLLTGKHSIVHLHWPEQVFNAKFGLKFIIRLSLMFLKVLIAKLQGLRLVWTIHNLESHGRLHPRLEFWFKCRFIGVIDGVIHLTDTGRMLAESRYPALVPKKSAVILHGHYRNAYPNAISKAPARIKLGLREDDRVVLFIGMVRLYKNVENLIRIFSAMSPANIRLVIAGSASKDYGLEQSIRRLASEDSRISLHLEHISNDDVVGFLNAADLVVLPYVDILNSGSAILALSFGRPVLVPQRGAMMNLQSGFGANRVHLYQDELNSQVLASVLEAVTSPVITTDIEVPDLPMEYDWEYIAEQTFTFYRNVLSLGQDSLEKEHVLCGAPLPGEIRR